MRACCVHKWPTRLFAIFVQVVSDHTPFAHGTLARDNCLIQTSMRHRLPSKTVVVTLPFRFFLQQWLPKSSQTMTYVPQYGTQSKLTTVT